MERLTERELYDEKVRFTKCARTNCPDKCAFCYIPDEANVKLKEYEDLEEKGLLVKIKCKVGDTVYHIDASNHIWEFEVKEIRIEDSIIAFCESKDELKSKASFEVNGFPYPRLFLTREQAEKALEEMKGADEENGQNKN